MDAAQHRESKGSCEHHAPPGELAERKWKYARLEERREVQEESLDVRVDGERLAENLQLDAGRIRIARRIPGAAARRQTARFSAMTLRESRLLGARI